jgi:hypothetical protein
MPRHAEDRTVDSVVVSLGSLRQIERERIRREEEENRARIEEKARARVEEERRAEEERRCLQAERERRRSEEAEERVRLEREERIRVAEAATRARIEAETELARQRLALEHASCLDDRRSRAASGRVGQALLVALLLAVGAAVSLGLLYREETRRSDEITRESGRLRREAALLEDRLRRTAAELERETARADRAVTSAAACPRIDSASTTPSPTPSPRPPRSGRPASPRVIPKLLEGCQNKDDPLGCLDEKERPGARSRPRPGSRPRP